MFYLSAFDLAADDDYQADRLTDFDNNRQYCWGGDGQPDSFNDDDFDFSDEHVVDDKDNDSLNNYYVKTVRLSTVDHPKINVLVYKERHACLITNINGLAKWWW